MFFGTYLRDVAIVMALCFLVFDTVVFQPSVAEGEGIIPDPEKREYFLYSGMTPGEYKKQPLKLAKDEFVAICNRKVDEKLAMKFSCNTRIKPISKRT